MTGEPTHTTSEMVLHAPIIIYKAKYPLCFIVSYVQPITQHFGSRNVRKAPLQSTHTERKKWCRAPQKYQLLSEK